MSADCDSTDCDSTGYYANNDSTDCDCTNQYYTEFQHSTLDQVEIGIPDEAAARFDQPECVTGTGN